MLDAHQLNVFLAAADSLNFTQAAQQLGMSQPSVSQHIQALERYFQVPLFIRSTRSLQLTDAAITLVPLAREMVRHSIHIEETMASLQGEVFGHLIVGCSTTPGKYILPHLLTKFHHEYSKVRITCQVSPQSQAIEMLSLGHVNFALTSETGVPCKNIEFHKFLEDTISLIVPNEHPWAQRGIIQPGELFEENFLMREIDSGTYIVVNAALSEIDVNTNSLDILMTLGNSEAIALAVQEGLGVGFVSEIIVRKLGYGRVVPIQIDGLNIHRNIYIGRNTNRPTTIAQSAFWEFILDLPYPYPLI